MQFSVIIPTLNEATNIERLIKHLKEHGGASLLEIIVVDGGSSDGTPQAAVQAGAHVIDASRRGRAIQMNRGAARASGDILYFVHADTLPPASFALDIRHAFSRDFPIGCFRFRFDSNRTLLKLNAWFTRFDLLWCRGGDQSLFVSREVFQSLGGFSEDHLIMEEYDFILRARKHYDFCIIPKEIIVSARKYETNSYLRVQLANFTAFAMFRMGFPQRRIYHTYRKMLDYR